MTKRKSMKEQLHNTTQQEEDGLEERFRRAEGLLGQRREASSASNLRRVARTTFSLPHETIDTIGRLRDIADKAGMRTPTQAQVVRAAIAELELVAQREGAAGLKERIGALEELPHGRQRGNK